MYDLDDLEERRDESIPRSRAFEEVQAHGLSLDLFTQDCGLRDAYTIGTLFDWLGY